jgi:PTH2 family peptidyl-tRNA hydrolase
MVKEVKQVILWRNDLKVRKGKIAAQCAHASLKVFLDRMYGESKFIRIFPSKKSKTLYFEKDDPVDRWINGSFTKIVLKVDSEEQLLELHNQAKEAGLLTSLIQDSGKTEFNGIPTYTCCAIGPNLSEDIDKITGRLELM